MHKITFLQSSNKPDFHSMTRNCGKTKRHASFTACLLVLDETISCYFRVLIPRRMFHGFKIKNEPSFSDIGQRTYRRIVYVYELSAR